ncbi:MAG: hypothetical protein WCR72_01270 [Bacteroidota bacterium]
MRTLARAGRCFAFSVMVWSSLAVSAQKTPNQVLRSVYQKMMKVKDYSVEATIRADIPLIKILPVNAVVYFKQPDKFRLVSKSIAILPRQGFSDLAKVIKDSTAYTAVNTGNETVDNTPARVISLIPASDTGDLVLAKFWIDVSRMLILKTQLTTRSSGTMQIEYFYGSQVSFGLPDKMIFTVDVKKFKIPKIVATDLKNPGPQTKENTKASKKGVIDIKLQNYSINKGVKDEVFR